MQEKRRKISERLFDICLKIFYNTNMKKTEMNEKLKAVYDFTVQYLDNYGYPPSVREICAELNIKSTATAYSYIEKLKDKGLLTKDPQKKRALSVSGASQKFKSVPLVGVIAAGQPIFAVENLEGYIPLPDDFGRGEEQFALRVKGESMINVGIFNNDIIIISRQNTAENGDIVAALVEDEATVKRFYKRDGKFILHPENDTMQDMVFDEVSILGKVKGLLRKF